MGQGDLLHIKDAFFGLAFLVQVLNKKGRTGVRKLLDGDALMLN